jgi:Arylsulfotransferase (ASST)
MILDGRGRLVWFRPVSSPLFSTDLRLQRYRGEPVLTWWEGTTTGSVGEGVIVDSSYREIARVRAGNGRKVDPHELVLTSRGTALITCSPAVVQTDLSSVGGARDGKAYESIVQEVDVQTGRVLLEWRSLDHVPVSESYMAPGGIYDYFHANSIDVLPDGNLLLSGRHTWTLYKLDRRTGRVIWRLGGKRSDFAIERRARFAWQHDATRLGTAMIGVFDNGAARFENFSERQSHSRSRGLMLAVDEAARAVELVHAYRHSPPLLTSSFGSVQLLASGEVVIGWGDYPAFSQYRPGGGLVEEVRMPLGYASYRAFRAPWKASPAERPAVAVRRHRSRRRVTLYASWNGATAVSAWEVLAGRHRADLHPVARAKSQGFETALDIPAEYRYVSVRALGMGGQPQASSPVVAA